MNLSFSQIFLSLGILYLISSCSRIGNYTRSFGVDCGGEAKYDAKIEEIFKIYLDGNPLAPNDVERLSLNGTDMRTRLSSKGCFSLDIHEDSIVAVTHRDGQHAAVFHSSIAEKGVLNRVNLEHVKPINMDPKDKDLIFRDFCVDANRTLYLPSSKLAFFLNFSPLTHKTALTVTAHVSKGDFRELAELVASTRLVEPQLEEFTISVPGGPENLGGGIPSLVEIDVVDVFGNKITSQKCEIHITPNAPRMHSIAGSPYFGNMFVRSKSMESMEFSIESESPIRKLEIQYIDSRTGNKDKAESYVPFYEKDSLWKVLAPLPKLSGVKTLVMTTESMSGLKVQEHAVLNFGEKKYVEGGVKLTKLSQNERFMVLASYTGLVKVLDIDTDKFTFEKKLEDDVKYVDVTNDGRKLILGLSSRDLILDIEADRALQPDTQFSKLGFRLHSDQKHIIGTLNADTFAWLSLDTGEVIRTRKIDKALIKYWKISDDDSIAFYSADNRKIYLSRLANSIVDLEIDPPCGNSLISLIEIARSGDFAIFGCDTKVYLKDLRNFEEKPVLLLEFNTNTWAIAISPDNLWVAAGSMSGEWYSMNLQTKKQYPGTELETLRKGYKFKTTVNTMSFSSDSKFLVAGTEDGTAKVFSIEDADFVEAIKADGQILTAGFLNSKQKFYIGSIDGLLRRQDIHSPLYTLDLGQRVETMALFQDILAIGTSPRADDLSENAAGTFLFDISNRKIIGKIPNSKKVNSISFDPGGQKLLTASEDGTAKIGFLTDLSSSLSIGLNHRKPGRPVRTASISRNGRGVIVVSSKKASAYHIDDYETPFLSLEAPEWIADAHFSSDNRYISTAAADRIARIHDARDGRVVASYTAKNWVWDADLTPDLATFVNLNWDHELVIQKTQRDEDGNIIGLTDISKVPLPNGGEFMALSPDSNWAAVSLWNGQAFMVNLKDRFSYEMRCLPATQALRPVFSADSRFVAFGQGNAAMVYQVQDGRPVQRAYHADRVTSVGFSKGNLVSGSWDGKVRVTEINEKAVVDCTSE